MHAAGHQVVDGECSGEHGIGPRAMAAKRSAQHSLGGERGMKEALQAVRILMCQADVKVPGVLGPEGPLIQRHRKVE